MQRLIVSGWIIQRLFGRCFHACTTLLKMSALLETSLKRQWMPASFFPRCWSLLSAAVDLYPETILSAAGFNRNISVAWTDLTVFCRALFSLCMLPDMINVLFHIYSRVWRESCEVVMFLNAVGSQCRHMLCWRFDFIGFCLFISCVFYVLVSAIRSSLQRVYCGCSA